MAYQDLREFLSALEQEGQLLNIEEEVKPEPDIGAAGRAAANLGGSSPGAFVQKHLRLSQRTHCDEHDRLLGKSCADARTAEKYAGQRTVFEFARRFAKFPVAVRRETKAPFQENQITEDINLFELFPLFRLNRGDGGFYIDKAVVVSRDQYDPEHFGKQNAGVTAFR
ncbi:hypothetical protein HMSSN036_22630 [Paenibacillus macerans]|nr:hypothetical protein HMSSN036_22630 [Paenibacillus macerans]